MGQLSRLAAPHAAALLLVAAACGGGGGNGTPPPPPATCTFTNPLASGADPWVVERGGWYYLIKSRDNGIWVSRSQRLSEVVTASAVRVWTPPATGWNQTNIWAPELHYVDGRWYIYYAAGSAGPPFIHQRSGVLESVGEDPQGAYTDKGMLYTGDDLAGGTDNKWAIDLTVGRLNGQLYAVWSGWEQNASTDRTPQHTYIATMSNPWTISSNRVKISSPTEEWEGTVLPLQEGQELLMRGDDVFIIYSAAESWMQYYKLGQLRLQSPTADPLDPASWTKSGPVFSSSSGVYGVGHASFVKSPDGTEDWIVYHSKTTTAEGWDDRVIRMKPFGWKADGSPDFGSPGAPTQTLPRPAGECD
jgi:GH43 family beta-xylosidase